MFNPALNGQVPGLEIKLREELASVVRLVDGVNVVEETVKDLVRELNGKYHIFFHHAHAPEVYHQLVAELTRVFEFAHLEGLVLKDAVEEIYTALVRSGFEFQEPIAHHPIGWITVAETATYIRRSVDDINRFCREGRLVHRVVDGTTWIKASSLFAREHWDHIHGKKKSNRRH